MATKKKSSKSQKSILATLLLILLAIISYFVYPEIISGDPSDVTPTPTQTVSPQPTTIVENGDTVKIHVIDVGQGDAILLECKSGYMLIDAGPGSGEKALKKYLQDRGITTLEYVFFTHPHEDHIGGADMIMRDFTVKNVYMPSETSTSKTFAAMLDAIEASDADVYEPVSGESFDFGGMHCRFLAPNSEKYSKTNDYSIVMRITFGSVSMMFTGDAEGNKGMNKQAGESEIEILEKYTAAELQSDFIKIGHHGSTTSTSAAFLAAVNPKIAAISVGEGNDYGHPHQEILDALTAAGIPYYRTDLSGSLIFVCDGKTVTYQGK